MDLQSILSVEAFPRHFGESLLLRILHPELGDGYKAAIVNFGFIANALLSTDEVVKAMGG